MRKKKPYAILAGDAVALDRHGRAYAIKRRTKKTIIAGVALEDSRPDEDGKHLVSVGISFQHKLLFQVKK